MKQAFFPILIGSIVIVAGVFALGVQQASAALECSWTESEYRCTPGYWSSQYQCTWYDPAPYQSCTPSTTYEQQCGWEVQCDSDDANCKLVWKCTSVAVPSTNCTTIDPAPYKVCEYNTVWVSGSCGNYPTVKTQTCPAGSETSCLYATDCSTSGSKNVTSYSCGSSGCVPNTAPATCTRTFPACSNNIGETGVVCGGSCTAPPDKTLSVSVTATPSSGIAPLNNIEISATVDGTATGDITYKLDCTNDGTFDTSASTSVNPYTFLQKCNYESAGSYVAKVQVTRQTLATSNTASVTVTAVPSLSYPSSTWQRLWYTDPKTNNFSNASYLGEGPNESVEKFTNDWVGNAIAYGKYDNIGFKSSRTINFPFAYTYRFTVGADDGFRLSIDGGEKLSEWNDNNYNAHVKTVDVYLAAGNHTFQFDYYENTGNAKVSFGYELAPCNKLPSVTPSTFSMEVPSATSTGKKSIAATVSHWGADNDGSGVVLERSPFDFFGDPLGGARVHLDDLGTGAGSTGDCDDDVVWDTVWFNEGLGSTRLEIRRFSADFKGGHTLTYGYDLALTDAVFKATGSRTERASASVSGAGSGPITFNADDPNKPASNITYAVVECTTSSHCSAYPGKTTCYLGSQTTNLTPNTCIDSVAPTSRITIVEDNSKKQPGFAPNIPFPGDHSAFLKGDNNGDTAKTWWLAVEDKDNGVACTLDTCTCYISINGVTRQGASRMCNGWVSFTIGKDYPETPLQDTDCAEEGNDKCKIKVWTQDKAGNKNDAALLEREIGVNPISSLPPFNGDEQKYKDFTAYPSGFNVWNFGVDWTPPTAQ